MKARRLATKCNRNAAEKQPSISRSDIRLDERLRPPLRLPALVRGSIGVRTWRQIQKPERVTLSESGWPKRDKLKHGSGRSTEAAGRRWSVRRCALASYCHAALQRLPRFLRPARAYARLLQHEAVGVGEADFLDLLKGATAPVQLSILSFARGPRRAHASRAIIAQHII
jgi:hypothetical protein